MNLMYMNLKKILEMEFTNMKQKNLWLLCGIPGSGKSTWCAKAIKKSGAVRVSRDVVRFAMLEDNEDYFAHEDDVFKEFVRLINENIWDNDVTDIFVDATHLNERSRNKLLHNINLTGVTLNAINFIIDFELACERNDLREGRSRVPQGAMQSMFNAYRPARKGEKYDYNKVIDMKITKEGVIAYDIYDF